MGLYSEYFGAVGAAALDGQGQITLVNFGTQAFLVEEFPATVKFTIVLIVRDDENPKPVLVEDASLLLRLEILGPDGQPVAIGSSETPVWPKSDDRLSRQFQAILDYNLPAQEPGKYILRAEVRVAGSEDDVLKVERPLLILPQPAKS